MKRILSLLTLLCAIVGGMKADVIATWDFAGDCANLNMSLSSALTEIVSDVNTVKLEIAGAGSIRDNGDSYQVAQGITLKIPVHSTKDFVRVAGYNNDTYSNYAYGSGETLHQTTYHQATAAEATQGFVEVVSKDNNNYYYSITVVQKEDVNLTADREVLWDFQNGSPAALASFTKIENAIGSLPSTVDGVFLYVDASNGKLWNNSDNAGFNDKTELRIPVLSSKDVVTIVAYNDSYAKYTVGGVAATGATTEHTVTAAEAKQGFVEVIATAQAYLFSIKVVQKSIYEEKSIYSTDFSDWDELTASTTETVVEKTTKYTKETLAFTFYNTGVNTGDYDVNKFPDNNGYRIYCPKNPEGKNPSSYVITSALASITKVRFVHGATGSNRGYKLEVKGDGDTDWVTVSESVANPSGWCEVNANVNRTNCQLRFTNLSEGNYAYIFELEIFGMADLSGSPLLDSFEANGTSYSADLFEMNGSGDYVAEIELSKTATMISESNPISNIVAASGTIGTVTYLTTGEGTSQQTVVTIPVTANEETVNYKATFVFKPDFTLTYYNTDGSEMGTQQVEKDAAIGAFDFDYTTATATDGNKVRGWFKKSYPSEKYTTADIVTDNLPLYAVQTEIEEASDFKKYTFNLTSTTFYAEDHEAFNPTGGVWHDATHGWVFSNGNTIDLLVGPKATIFVTLCVYSKEGAKILVKKGNTTLETLDGQSATDGGVVSYNYEGEAGTLTLEISAGGSVYIHEVKIVNSSKTNYTKIGQWYIVNKNNVSSFIDALDAVNGTNSSTSAERSYIFLPNGTYDLGITALTKISGHNISIIGESRDGVIIKNTPEKEGIAITATLLNTGTNNYLQDLTLNCIAPYGTGDDTSTAERGVALQDKGNKTICKNVYLKGLQDTYYSNGSDGMLGYFENSKIEGTVDFLCGNGSIMFNECDLYVTARSTGASSANVITAHKGSNTDKGYLFSSCTIDGIAAQDGKYNLGRPWGNASTKSAVTYINTKMYINASAAGWGSMNNVGTLAFHEYYTQNSSGDVVDTHNTDGCGTPTTKEDPLYLDAEGARGFGYDKFFDTGSWDPATLCAVLPAPEVTCNGTTASWDAVDGAVAYVIYDGGTFAGITTETSYATTSSDITVKAANALGAIGSVSATITSAGYATFVPTAKVAVPDGVTAYITKDAATTVKMTAIDVIPANTPVILKGSAGTYKFLPTNSAASDVTGNLLQYSPSVTISEGEYILAKGGNGVGFYPATTGSVIKARKAFLAKDASGASVLPFDEDDNNTTGIADVRGQMEDVRGDFYDLQGRKVTQPTKGLYIHSGKKVIVK